MKTKRMAGITSLILTAGLLLSGCGTQGSDRITVISREDGSGTRSAFIELFEIEQKDANGNKIDHTVETAEITEKTSVMMTTVAGNPNAVGYISLGSLNDTVKALSVDGVAPSIDNVKNGSYKIARPFYIATRKETNALVTDFIAYILSEQGQAIVEKNGYISQGNNGAYSGSMPAGSITVAGSSSVTPVMEKLKEGYLAVNTKAKIDIQQSDSTTGVNSVIDGVCDIGMASRELKESETAAGIAGTAIALDGIAVIVNHKNALTDISSEAVKNIYTGTVTAWSELTES